MMIVPGIVHLNMSVHEYISIYSILYKLNKDMNTSFVARKIIDMIRYDDTTVLSLSLSVLLVASGHYYIIPIQRLLQ